MTRSFVLSSSWQVPGVRYLLNEFNARAGGERGIEERNGTASRTGPCGVVEGPDTRGTELGETVIHTVDREGEVVDAEAAGTNSLGGTGFGPQWANEFQPHAVGVDPQNLDPQRRLRFDCAELKPEAFAEHALDICECLYQDSDVM
jgi:hypothetical protein